MTSARPRVSVLLPCRDAEPHLPACIESLEAQTLGAWEAVAVDDGSRDGTGDLLRDWSRREPRVRVLRGGDGLVPSLEAAAGAARASLLARMDADDVARPERLERQLSFLDARPDLAACGAGVRYRPRDRVGPGYRRYERWINGLHEPGELRRALFVECPVAHPTLVIRRSVYRALGGYRDVGWPEDYDLLLRLHGAPVLDPDGFREAFPAPGGPGDAYVLGAVGVPGVREEIREALASTGREELRDYRMVA